MRLKTKLVLLVGGILLLLLVGLVLLKLFEQNRGRLLVINAQDEKQQVFDRILELRGGSLETLAYDYTYWDDMVKLVEDPESSMEFAHGNLDTCLETYETNGIWILRTDFSLVYSVTTEDVEKDRLPVSISALSNLLSKKPYFRHFFVLTAAGVMEIRTAPIQPTSDSERVTLPKGFFITGRIWTPEYQQDLMRLTGSSITVAPVSMSSPPPTPGYNHKTGDIMFSRLLMDLGNKPLIRLDVSTPYPILSQLDKISNKQLILYIFLGTLALLTMSLLLTRWITTPMGLLTKSLDAEAPNILVSLKSQRSEMGRLGQLITQFFDQKKKLLEEISQRKQAEEEVMAYAKRLEQSNQALDEFARVVAHDLKVPLSVISSLSELLMEHCRQKQDSASLNDLQQMQLATKQMNNLIGDLLEVSRLSRVPNQLRMVNIEELLSDILARFDHVIREKDAEVIIRDPMPAIQCDRVRLGEVFANLISNAIKYNDKPRCHIEIGCKKKREGYQFSVSDNGKGIDQKDFGHIFEIFQRLENVGTEEGTGVGLAIVKKVVELHNGKIWIESALGVGAIFYFIIPTDEMVLTGKKALSDING